MQFLPAQRGERFKMDLRDQSLYTENLKELAQGKRDSK